MLAIYLGKENFVWSHDTHMHHNMDHYFLLIYLIPL